MLDNISVPKMDIRSEISFFKEEDIECPSCSKIVVFEEMKTGRGRLDAGPLSMDLHRVFIATEEFGQAYPFLYNVATCNHCFFSALKHDFTKLKTDTLENIKGDEASKTRVEFVSHLFEKLPNFIERKNLVSGIASYLLAVATYNQFSKRNSPTIRMALCTLRTAWLCQHIRDLGYEDPNINFLIKVLYRKAFFLYDRALELGMKGEEDLSENIILGPDVDNNYGYDGVIYMHAWLCTNYGSKANVEMRLKQLHSMRTNLSKVFGFGRASKEKPSALLNIARSTFDQIENELRKLE